MIDKITYLDEISPRFQGSVGELGSNNPYNAHFALQTLKKEKFQKTQTNIPTPQVDRIIPQSTPRQVCRQTCREAGR
jgi:hypothetical protein